MVVFSASAFLNKSWTDIGLGVLGIWLISQLLISRLEQIPAAQREWMSHHWERLNDYSMMEFLFLVLVDR
jgi:hypothetical protein